MNEQSYQSVRDIFSTVASLDTSSLVMLVFAVCGLLLGAAAVLLLCYFALRVGWFGTKGAGSLVARAARWLWREAPHGEVCQAVLEELRDDEEPAWDAAAGLLDAGSVRIKLSSTKAILNLTTGDDRWDVLPDLTPREKAAITAAAWQTVERVKVRLAENHKRTSLVRMGHRDRADVAKQRAG